jgi:predicted flap endonuclease-1-like 5' DNA nuclease
MSLNPWVALLLGILIGWLLEWLLELWFFRRRRLECQERLSQVEADLHAKEIELDSLRTQVDNSVNWTVAKPEAVLPEVEAKAPEDSRSVNWTVASAEPETPPATGADDLEIIEGIGPVYARKLRAAGITTFAQLAGTAEARLTEIIAAQAWQKVSYSDWIAQAQLAAAGDAAGLKALQERLFSRETTGKRAGKAKPAAGK